MAATSPDALGARRGRRQHSERASSRRMNPTHIRLQGRAARSRKRDTVLSKCLTVSGPMRRIARSKIRPIARGSKRDFRARRVRAGRGDILMRSPVGIDIPRYHAATPTNRMSADCEGMALYAGAGRGTIKTIRPCRSVHR